jgi:hypothetical protein
MVRSIDLASVSMGQRDSLMTDNRWSGIGRFSEVFRSNNKNLDGSMVDGRVSPDLEKCFDREIESVDGRWADDRGSVELAKRRVKRNNR